MDVGPPDEFVFLIPCCIFFVFVLVMIPAMIGMWKVFEKAGEPGWAAIVPVYNVMTLAKVAGNDPVQGLLMLIPCVGIVFYVLVLIDLTRRFRVEGGYVAGLLFLPFVFWPMLGFGSAMPRGAKRGAWLDEEGDEYRPPRRRRREVDEEEDEEDDRPRRRRPRYDDDD